jgi:Mg2+ and Co2+ transporter CorA
VRGEFLHFSNYWYFDELANKDEEIEHFTLQCRQFRIESTKKEVEEEIEKLNASLHDYSAFRNTEAVNRLAMLSLIVGAGAVLTGFFGMNFGRNFARWFFEPDTQSLAIHYAAVILVALLAFGALAFGFYVVAANWSDYRDILAPGRMKRRADSRGSLKRE